MPEDGRLNIDFGDGVSALDRSSRAIVLGVSEVVGRIVAMGWKRHSVEIEVSDEDPLPCWIRLKGKRVYEVDVVVGDDGGVSIQGRWLHAPKAPSIIDRIMGR